MKKIHYDKNPKYGGLLNFASNGVKDKASAFEYGFRLGWQTCWHEVNEKKCDHRTKCKVCGKKII